MTVKIEVDDVDAGMGDDQIVILPPAEVTMTSTIRLCIKNKPQTRIVEDGYTKTRQVERLTKLLIEGDPVKCLSLWSELRPEYDIEAGKLIFKNETIRIRGPIGFRNELESYNFPPSLLDAACDIHNSLERIIRKKDNRIELFFFCLYHASHNLKMRMYPEEIAERIGLTRVGMTKALNSINPLHYGMAITNFYPTPQYYVPRILEDMKLDPSISDIASISIDNMLSENPMITNFYKPQKIAMAAVMNFLDTSGIEPPEDLDHILLQGNQYEIKELMTALAQYDHL